MTTLAARVLEAIKAAEQLVKVPTSFGWPQEESWHTRRCGADWGNQNCECECPVPAAVLRRCAADRAIVERCTERRDGFALAQFVLERLAEGYGVPLEQEET